MQNRTKGAICRLGMRWALVSCCLTSPIIAQTQAPSLEPYGRCTTPSQQGVNICMPYQGAEVASPFQVIGAGTSGRGQVALMQLWADGRKIMQTPGTPFDEPIALPLGAHQLTLIEVDDTGFYSKSEPLNVTVVDSSFSNQECPPPGSPGVNVCQPSPNSCNVQPGTYISAAGKGESGPVIRMEVWISGAKVANFPGDHFETNMILFDSSYTMEIWEIDSHGHSLKSALFLDGPC